MDETLINTLLLSSLSTPFSRRVQYDFENEFMKLFSNSPVNIAAYFDQYETNPEIYNCLLLAYGRYLKSVSESKTLKEVSLNILDRQLTKFQPMDEYIRALLYFLKQCVQLFNVSPLGHIQMIRNYFSTRTSAIIDENDYYLQYKFIRLIRIIIDKQKIQNVDDLFPLISDLLEYVHDLLKQTKSPNYIIGLFLLTIETFVLNNRNVTEIKVKLNQIYKDYYQSSLLFMLNQTDFDDNETIEYCLVLLQMNLKNQSCTFSIHDIFIDLLTYIDYDIETMFNWLLSPETEHYFLVLLLKLCKYFAINNNHKQLQLVTVYERTMITMKQFYEKLNNAQQKQLFPYDIKPLLNVFKVFNQYSL